MKGFLSIGFMLMIVGAFGQCPTASFALDPQYCREESVNLTSNLSGEDSYSWHFCEDTISSSISTDITLAQVVNAFRASYASEYIESINAIVTIRNNGELWYNELNDNLDNITHSLLISGTGDPFSFPRSINFLYEDDIWKAIVANEGSINPTVLEFNDGFVNTNITNYSITTGNVTVLKGSDYVESGASKYFFTGDNGGNTINVFDFGSTINATPTHSTFTVGSVSQITEIEIIETCDGWKGLITSSPDQQLFLLDFDSGIDQQPTITEIANSSDGLTAPTFLNIVESRGKYYVFLQNDSGNTFRLNFGESIDNSFTIDDFGSLTPKGYSVGIATGDLMKLFVVDIDNSTKGIYLNNFDSNCGVTPPVVYNKDTALTYTTSGNYEIELVAQNASGKTTFSQSFTILPQTAPSITHSSQEVCVSNPITFTPSNSGLSSYSWDFDGDDIEDSTDPTPSFDYSVVGGGPGPGTYTVRVDVSDGTCNNFYEEEVTIYPDPPVPAFTVTASECVNTDITFTNDTDESQHMGVISYMWDFDNDGTIDSTDPNPTYAYSTPGTKTVVLYDTIPGCSNVSATWDIDISPGPTAGFTPSTTSACEGDVISFTDSSSGDSQDYFWDFQNGFTSTVPNPPAQLYENSGSYFVSLRTTDAQGCEDTFIQEIAISASPQINIDFDIPCTSPDGVQFFDLTTVEGADIVSWSWEVDGEEVSTLQNPTINFNSTGVKTIGLTVLSSNGCEQYATEDIEVLTAPSPDFSINLGCQGEVTAFTDETVSSGNPIVSWLWTLDGINYGTQDINHVFENPGSYDVTLEVTGQNFCSETITQTVDIIELPQVGFVIEGECDNQIIQAIDESTVSEDPVVSRRWMLDGVSVGNGSELLLDEMEDGSYELELELETEFGCLVSTSQTLEINDAPESSFISSRTYGIPGDQLTFTNTSTGGTSYQWLLDGALRSTESGAESITFPNPGEYKVGLVSENSFGCYDTATQNILIATPEVDLAIGSFELVNENNTGKIFMEIQNFSNLPVEITEAQLVLENEFRVSEQILEFIGVGESSLVSLNVGIPLTVSEPSYFCVTLTSQYVDFDDINPINNEKCLTIQPAVQVEDPFPNPVTDQFRLKVILPAEGTATVRLINSAGKIHKENRYEATTGLNNFFVDMSTLNPGIYYVTVDVLGNTFKRKVIKL
ncbi:PKD domain-containing protein [Ekhidna sp.]|uniref:PKD domain-containing protein n=1 Tax=Ekhidna sp. TaxID=2608089 RepID=UPI003C7C6A62